MELKKFCAAMELSEDAVQFLKPHWETILEKWDGKLPTVVAGESATIMIPTPSTEEETPSNP